MRHQVFPNLVMLGAIIVLTFVLARRVTNDWLALFAALLVSLLRMVQPQVRGLDIAGRSLYCQETGGDYYDFLSSPSGNRIRWSLPWAT